MITLILLISVSCYQYRHGRYAYSSFNPQHSNFGPTGEVFPGFGEHRLEDGELSANSSALRSESMIVEALISAML